jgi:hypothetical protein
MCWSVGEDGGNCPRLRGESLFVSLEWDELMVDGGVVGGQARAFNIRSSLEVSYTSLLNLVWQLYM